MIQTHLAIGGKIPLIKSLSYGRDDDDEVEKVESIPVGYEIPIMMYSLDFEEFLWANGYSDDAIAYLKELFEKRQAVPNDIHQKYEELVREFFVALQ